MDSHPSSKDQVPKIPIYEKTAACLLIVLILIFTLRHMIEDEGILPETTEEAHYIVSPFVEITITGAVSHPGTYQVKKGTTVEEVLKMAKPLPSAQLKKINIQAKINRKRTIDIKSTEKAK